MRASIPRLLLAAALVTGQLALGGCATRPTDPEALADYQENNDPLEPTNRVFYSINNGIDTVVLRPLAVGYRYAVPRFARDRIHNVLANLSNPVIFANDVLEAKPRRAGDTFMRTLINTTAGVGGLFDVATDWGYPAHDADSGLTFALWGIPEGPFLFLPVLGPSNPRDAVGFAADIYLDPITYPGNGGGFNAFRITRTIAGAIDARERVLDETDNIQKTALDPYATFRSLYRQYRTGQVDRARNDSRATVPAWFPQH